MTDSDRRLSGLHVLIARVGNGEDSFGREMEQAGARVTVSSVVSVCPPSDPEALDACLERIDSFDWLVLTSRNTVDVIRRRIRVLRLEGKRPGRIAVVGRATGAALDPLGWMADLIPEREDAVALAQALKTAEVETDGVSVLLPQSEAADPYLATSLSDAGFTVTAVVAYTLAVNERVARDAATALARGVDCVVFASPSAARAVAAAAFGPTGETMAAPALISTSPGVTLGHRTEVECRRLGFRTIRVARSPSSADVGDAVWVATRPRP